MDIDNNLVIAGWVEVEEDIRRINYSGKNIQEKEEKERKHSWGTAIFRDRRKKEVSEVGKKITANKQIKRPSQGGKPSTQYPGMAHGRSQKMLRTMNIVFIIFLEEFLFYFILKTCTFQNTLFCVCVFGI